MKNARTKLFVLIVSLFGGVLGGFALALELDLIEVDWTALTADMSLWYKSPLHLAPYVAASIALIRLAWKGLDGFGPVLLAAAVIGAGLGLNGHWQGYLVDGVFAAVQFGVVAAGLAVGITAWFDRLAGKASSKRTSDPELPPASRG